MGYKITPRTIITVVIVLLGFQLHAQNKSQSKDLKTTVVYTINDKNVSIKEFGKFLGSLKEIKDTWFCAETNYGGITGYDAKDKLGKIYEYRAKSDQSGSTNSIKKKTTQY